MYHVGRAAEAEIFRDHAEHRHGSLGRQALHFAPNKTVEHQIADDQQTHGAELFNHGQK